MQFEIGHNYPSRMSAFKGRPDKALNFVKSSGHQAKLLTGKPPKEKSDFPLFLCGAIPTSTLAILSKVYDHSLTQFEAVAKNHVMEFFHYAYVGAMDIANNFNELIKFFVV